MVKQESQKIPSSLWSLVQTSSCISNCKLKKGMANNMPSGLLWPPASCTRSPKWQSTRIRSMVKMGWQLTRERSSSRNVHAKFISLTSWSKLSKLKTQANAIFALNAIDMSIDLVQETIRLWPLERTTTSSTLLSRELAHYHQRKSSRRPSQFWKRR